MATVTRAIYHRFYGLAVDIAQLTPSDPAEDVNMTAILRITDQYFCTDTHAVLWWDGSIWSAI